ncbi:DNA topoisomerase 3-alpha [Ananas comosus]|uniref:DNA topoisomerase 3-alpha n=1 Tax=Ananas comosus TaxID=4615 RepID=A0A199V8R0_ANACO|nr:DNA topoisomerase 3-alpha [Ananas comosus]
MDAPHVYSRNGRERPLRARRGRGRRRVETMHDDANYLALVEEAEAAVAGKAKRPKLADEGSYTAALKGSHSFVWQQQQQQQQKQKQQRRTPNQPIYNSKSDFRSSIWSKEGGGKGEEIPERACPCGSGTCSVLTSATAKNPGRKFYRCPLRAVENGGCNFFEWCDSPSSSIPTAPSTTNYQSGSSAPELPCPCGAGSCPVLTTKTGKNVGRQYYRCPADGNGSCGFFKWCDDHISVASQPSLALQKRSLNNSLGSQLSNEKSSSSCFKCGQKGHWAKDCPNQSSDSYADKAGSRFVSSTSGTCFKCGKPGHWSRDCPNQKSGAAFVRTNCSNAFRSC